MSASSSVHVCGAVLLLVLNIACTRFGKKGYDSVALSARIYCYTLYQHSQHGNTTLLAPSGPAMQACQQIVMTVSRSVTADHTASLQS
jgi:hypothetical protein